MQVSIRSDILHAVIDTFGAELCSVTDYNDTEYLWQAEEKVWKRHAPILFPFICNTKSGKYTVNGKEYRLSNHGFARDSDFELLVSKDNSAEFCLSANDKTLEAYPYRFKLYVNYSLEENKLKVKYTVKNTDDKQIFFYIGGHPAFRVPLAENEGYDDYTVVYEKPERIIQQREDGSEAVILDNARKIPVKHELFAHDVFMKNKPDSAWIALVSKSYDYKIKLHFNNEGCIAVWSSYFKDKPDITEQAEFVCLEPWSSAPIYCEKTEELTETETAIKLNPNEKYVFAYEIEIG